MMMFLFRSTASCCDVLDCSTSNLSVTFNPDNPPPLDPPPTQIEITPTAMNMLVGERRLVSATDNLGRKITASWAVDDGSVLELHSNGSMVALKSGLANITATYQGLTSITQATVNAGPALSMGTQRWNLQPLDLINNWLDSFVSARPNSPDSPDLYVLEESNTGKRSFRSAASLR